MDGALEVDRRPVAAELASVLSRFARMVRTSVRSHNLSVHGIDDEDVEQEVRIRLWTTLARNPCKPLPHAYVQKVVSSAVVDALRRENVRRRDLLHDARRGEEVPDVSHQPDSLLALCQWAEFLQHCIGCLPPRRQRPVQMFLLGYSLADVASASGLSLDAGSKLVRRGMADLRALLREHRRPD